MQNVGLRLQLTALNCPDPEPQLVDEAATQPSCAEWTRANGVIVEDDASGDDEPTATHPSTDGHETADSRAWPGTAGTRCDSHAGPGEALMATIERPGSELIVVPSLTDEGPYPITWPALVLIQ
jgi:hypothetical protein